VRKRVEGQRALPLSYSLSVHNRNRRGSRAACLYESAADHYERFIQQEIIRKTSKQSNQFERVLGQVLGGLASTVLINNTTRTDYVFLSTYEASLGDERLRAGVSPSWGRTPCLGRSYRIVG
jgi:hypothetical protein